MCFAIDAHFEMQMGRCGATRLAHEGYHLPRLDMIALLYQILGIVGITGLQAVGMLDADVVAIAVIDIGEDDLAFERGIDIVVGFGLQVDTRVGASATLAVGTDDLSAWQREMPADGIRRLDRIVAA